MNGIFSRRDFLARLTALGCTLPVVSAMMNTGDARAAPGTATPPARAGTLVHRGINYDVGTRLTPTFTTRQNLPATSLQSELKAIHDDLYCTMVGIYGGNVDRLIAGATAALAAGLQVRVQPRLVDAPIDQMLLQMTKAAQAAERLRTPGSNIVFDIGCELTLLGGGIIPGATFADRLMYFAEHLDELPTFNEKLSSLLIQAVAAARTSFGGQLTYGSGSWETVDWSKFDIVSVDLYRDAQNQATYVDQLRSYQHHGKPVWITEFGCCSYEGAAAKASSGNDIIDWSKTPPQITGSPKRDESVQATYIGDLLDLFAQEGIDGAFVYQFIEPELTYDPNPRYDLDMASFGVVKTFPASSAHPYETTGYWEPKAAFKAIATRYGAAVVQPAATPLSSGHGTRRFL